MHLIAGEQVYAQTYDQDDGEEAGGMGGMNHEVVGYEDIRSFN